jgi:uncharacterized protein (DUF58 family)
MPIEPERPIATPRLEMEETVSVAAESTEWLPRILAAMRAPRSLRFTREGKFFVGITLGVGFAAINTGNNLLYLLLGLLLALIVVSGIMSELSLRGLSVKRKLPMRAQVARPHVVEIEVANDKVYLPSYAIEVEDLRAGLPADKRCFFLKISPKSSQVAAYRRTPTKRGLDRHTGFRLATRFPFGLFEKSKVVSGEDELVIFPQVDAVVLPSDPQGTSLGGVASNKRGLGEEFLGLRRYREGDEQRDVYWKKSASLGHPVLRERAAEVNPEQRIRLDIEVESASAVDEAFERRIREAASRAVAYVKRGDRVVMLVTAGSRLERSIVATAQVGVDPLLRYLALVDALPRVEGTGDELLPKNNNSKRARTASAKVNLAAALPSSVHNASNVASAKEHA